VLALAHRQNARIVEFSGTGTAVALRVSMRPLLAVVVLLAGCPAPETLEFETAVPAIDDLEYRFPCDPALLGEGCAAPTLDQAFYYQVTNLTVEGVNRGTRAIYAAVSFLFAQRAKFADQNRVRWGPTQALFREEQYTIEVERLGPGRFRYVLRAKMRDQADSEYVDLLAGETEGDGAGRFGSLGIDFEAANEFSPDAHPSRGRIALTWDSRAFAMDLGPRVVETTFDGYVAPDGRGPFNATFRYAENTDGSGSIDFSVKTDSADVGTLEEDFTGVTTWRADGSGRADAELSGGDFLGFSIEATECWDSRFRSTYYLDTADIVATHGDPTTCIPPASSR
jgi:hypothetical protein